MSIIAQKNELHVNESKKIKEYFVFYELAVVTVLAGSSYFDVLMGF